MRFFGTILLILGAMVLGACSAIRPTKVTQNFHTVGCNATKGDLEFLTDNSDSFDQAEREGQEYREEYRISLNDSEYVVIPAPGASGLRGGVFLPEQPGGPTLTISDPLFTEVVDGGDGGESWFTVRAKFTIVANATSLTFRGSFSCNGGIELFDECKAIPPRVGARCG